MAARWALAVAAVAACGQTDPAPADGAVDAALGPVVAVTVPAVDVAAGQARTVCYYVDLELGPQFAVRRWESDISSGAHGLQVFVSPEPLQPSGTMTDACVFQRGAPTQLARWVYGADLAHDQSDLPVGVALPLPARVSLVIRLHLINPSDQDRTIAAEVRAIGTLPGAAYAPAAIYASYRTDLQLAPGAVTTVTGDCPVPPGVRLVRLSSQSMRHNNLIEIADDGGELFRSSDPSHPGESSWLTAPHAVAGRLRYRCRYLNSTDQVIGSGGVDGRDELCVMVAHVVPADGDVWCIDDVVAAPRGGPGRW